MVIQLSTSNKCIICDAASANSYVCVMCEENACALITRAGITYDRDGATVACLLDELDTSISRQSRMTARNGGRSADTPLPYDARAARVHAMLSECLTTWAKHYGALVIGPRGSARWLVGKLSDITLSPDCEPFLDELTQAVAAADRTIDRQELKDYVGICSADLGAGLYCTVDLYVSQGAPDVTCSRCGSVYNVSARRSAMLTAADSVTGTATEIARAVAFMGISVTANQIWKWKHRGKLTPFTTNVLGDPVYRLGDVLSLARK